MSSLECYPMHFVVHLFYVCLGFWVFFCIFTQRKTLSSIVIICACDNQPTHSIHIRPTAAASDQMATTRSFHLTTSSAWFDLDKEKVKQGLGVGLELTSRCQIGISTIKIMEMHVLDNKNLYKDIEWLMDTLRVWPWNTKWYLVWTLHVRTRYHVNRAYKLR